MDERLIEWIELVRAGRQPAADEAVLRVALLLESTCVPGRIPDSGNWRLYEEVLGEASARPPLSVIEHAEVVGRLVEILISHPLEVSMSWAIGKAHADAGAPALVEILERRGTSLSSESAYQLCIGLDGFVHPGKPIKIEVEGWAALETFGRSADSRLSIRARAVLEKLTND